MQSNKSSSVLDGTDVLKSVFDAPDSEMETFFDAIQGAMGEGVSPAAVDTFRKIVSGKPDRISVQKSLTEEISGFIRIFRGWHNEDYVWHIEPAAIRRTWKVPFERVLFAIAQTMNKVVPTSVEVKIWLPRNDWELKTITFKAIRLKDEWSIGENDLDALSSKLFEVLNPLV